MARLLLLLFSVCLHGGVAGALFLFSADTLSPNEEVYRVSLADFASPVAVETPIPEPPKEEAAVPEPPPEPEPAPVPEPKPEKPKPEETKVVSPKKKPQPPKPRAPKTEETAVPAAKPSAPAGPPGAQPRNVGGFSAYKSDHVDQRPSISRRVAPVYPNQAKRMNIEGRVTVQLVVDTSGAPQSCTVARAEPPGYFEEAALTAARKTRFIPGRLKGQPVNTLVLLPFAFKLR